MSRTVKYLFTALVMLALLSGCFEGKTITVASTSIGDYPASHCYIKFLVTKIKYY
jgi:hypothetical protein